MARAIELAVAARGRDDLRPARYTLDMFRPTMACNWGSKGVQSINTDITLSLSRLPAPAELGLRGERWSGHDGIAVGSRTGRV